MRPAYTTRRSISRPACLDGSRAHADASTLGIATKPIRNDSRRPAEGHWRGPTCRLTQCEQVVEAERVTADCQPSQRFQPSPSTRPTATSTIERLPASPILATPLSNLLTKQPAKNIRRPRLAHIQIGLLGTLLGGKLDLAQRRHPPLPSRLNSKRDHTRNIPKLHACSKVITEKMPRNRPNGHFYPLTM